MEKKYEILEYVDKTNNLVKSAKRLSDGEIFTIGDTIANFDDGEDYTSSIKKMHEYKEGYLYISTATNIKGKSFTIHLGDGTIKIKNQ